MLQINLENLKHLYITNQTHSLDIENILKTSMDFSTIKELIISRNQGFLNLPQDYENLEKVINFHVQNSFKFSTIVLIGIGGSSLGPKCILQALGGQTEKQVFIVDNIDPDEIQNVSQKLNFEETLFLVITKSGATPETIATYLYFREKADLAGLSVYEHFVFVTDPQKGYLRELSRQENIPVFDIPENVGGRFSVLSNVGLLFAALIGVDVKRLLKGADEINRKFLEDKNGVNEAWQLAKIQYELGQKGKNIQVVLPYSSRLNSFGDWYVQLLSESIGKELSLNGEKVNAGLTPIPAVGATDQHSQLQLFKEGPNDKLILFLNVLSFDFQVKIPAINHAGLEYLSNHTFNKLIQAEFEATKQSLAESNRPSLTIEITEVDAFHLGQLFQLFELSVACLGELYQIDTFNQPGVERGKVLTKEILEKSKN
jgi:glucose-6-phosphate isomerase